MQLFFLMIFQELHFRSTLIISLLPFLSLNFNEIKQKLNLEILNLMETKDCIAERNEGTVEGASMQSDDCETLYFRFAFISSRKRFTSSSFFMVSNFSSAFEFFFRKSLAPSMVYFLWRRR